MTLDQSARSSLLVALDYLIRRDPDRWPETLAQLAATACRQNPGQLSHFADAAVQVAANAHRLRLEGGTDQPEPG